MVELYPRPDGDVNSRERHFQVTDDPVDDRRLGQEELIG